MDIFSLNANQILLITDPQDLFDFNTYETQFKKLRIKWHPDKSSDKDAQKVFVHISSLYSMALTRINNQTWGEKTPIFDFVSLNSKKKYRFRYKHTYPFELGDVYISNTKIMYVIENKNTDLYENGIEQIKNIQYPNNSMQQEFQRFMPNITFNDKTDKGCIVIFERPKNSIFASDIIKELKSIEVAHVAWILSSLYNITTFFEHVGICHNSITPQNILIDLEKHGVFVIGGWWYTTKVGAKLIALSPDIVNHTQQKDYENKHSSHIIDRRAVKRIGIYCLGDISMYGSKLLINKSIPKQVIHFLRSDPANAVLKDFKEWTKVIENEFGTRKFVKFMDFTLY